MLGILNFCFVITFASIVLVVVLRQRPKMQLIAIFSALWFLVSAAVLSNLSIYRTDAYRYTVDTKLMDAIAYVEAYQLEYGSLPSGPDFNDWADEDYPNWGINYILHDGDLSRAQLSAGDGGVPSHYRLEVWTGDENQIYDSYGNQLSYDFGLR